MSTPHSTRWLLALATATGCYEGTREDGSDTGGSDTGDDPPEVVQARRNQVGQ